jgi:hypothetical protein
MTAILQENSVANVLENIQNHPAWYGLISGLQADKLLREKNTPYLFLLRKGELENDYYVTFVLPDLSLKHQPFVLTETFEGWFYENSGPGGPYIEETIDDVLHLIMHCQKNECKPFIRNDQAFCITKR